MRRRRTTAFWLPASVATFGSPAVLIEMEVSACRRFFAHLRVAVGRSDLAADQLSLSSLLWVTQILSKHREFGEGRARSRNGKAAAPNLRDGCRGLKPFSIPRRTDEHLVISRMVRQPTCAASILYTQRRQGENAVRAGC